MVLQPLLPRVATDADYSNGTVSSVLGTGICGKCGTSGEYIPFVVSQPRQKDASFKLTPTRFRRRRLCDQAPKVQQVPHCAVLFCRLSCARTLLYASAASLSAAGWLTSPCVAETSHWATHKSACKSLAGVLDQQEERSMAVPSTASIDAAWQAYQLGGVGQLLNITCYSALLTDYPALAMNKTHLLSLTFHYDPRPSTTRDQFKLVGGSVEPIMMALSLSQRQQVKEMRRHEEREGMSLSLALFSVTIAPGLKGAGDGHSGLLPISQMLSIPNGWNSHVVDRQWFQHLQEELNAPQAHPDYLLKTLMQINASPNSTPVEQRKAEMAIRLRQPQALVKLWAERKYDAATVAESERLGYGTPMKHA